jgi:hypothetical protein
MIWIKKKWSLIKDNICKVEWTKEIKIKIQYQLIDITIIQIKILTSIFIKLVVMKKKKKLEDQMKEFRIL